MNETERYEINNATVLHGDSPYCLDQLPVRRVSAESLGILERIGSPIAAQFAASLNADSAPDVKLTANDLIKFVWVHAEDPDVVLATALQCSPVYTLPVEEAALRFARAHMADLAQLGAVVQYITGSDRELQASNFRTHAPDLGGGSRTKKNG